MAGNDGDSDEARVLRPLQAAACTYRIAFGPRAGQKVLTVQGAMPRETGFKQTLCADIDGFSLHAAVRCGADDRQALEQLCRYITRPALANVGAGANLSVFGHDQEQGPRPRTRDAPVPEGQPCHFWMKAHGARTISSCRQRFNRSDCRPHAHAVLVALLVPSG